jgi:hypothetical protein
LFTSLADCSTTKLERIKSLSTRVRYGILYTFGIKLYGPIKLLATHLCGPPKQHIGDQMLLTQIVQVSVNIHLPSVLANERSSYDVIQCQYDHLITRILYDKKLITFRISGNKVILLTSFLANKEIVATEKATHLSGLNESKTFKNE